jgi:hypothetical protein
VDGEDVPKVLGKDVSDKEVNIVPAVGFAAGILGLDHKVSPRRRQGQNGFDLNAPEGLVVRRLRSLDCARDFLHPSKPKPGLPGTPGFGARLGRRANASSW